MRRASALLALLGSVAIAGPVFAQTQQQETARAAMLRAAFDLSTQAGDHGRALALAVEVGRIRMTPSLRLFMAEEHEFLSRDVGGEAHLLDAATEAAQCIRDATAQAAIEDRPRILRDCTQVLNRVNARVARVRVTVAPESAAGTRVRVNGRDVPSASWGVALPTLPGDVVVEAERPARTPLRRSYLVAAGASREVTISWAEDLPGAAPAAPVIAAPAHVAAPPSTPLRVLGWVTAGLGVASVVVGVVEWSRTRDQSVLTLNSSDTDGQAWTRYVNAVNPARARSLDEVCDQAGRDAVTSRDAAFSYNLCGSNASARAMAWGFGLGGVALMAAGAAVLALSYASGGHVEAAPVVSAGYGGATLRVRF